MHHGLHECRFKTNGPVCPLTLIDIVVILGVRGRSTLCSLLGNSSAEAFIGGLLLVLIRLAREVTGHGKLAGGEEGLVRGHEFREPLCKSLVVLRALRWLGIDPARRRRALTWLTESWRGDSVLYLQIDLMRLAYF